MSVFDVFPFFNEVDLLEIRLNSLNEIVDYFVITEAVTTFSGKEKPLYFEANRHRFRNFEHKIIHQVVDQIPPEDPFQRDWYQRDQAKSILKDSCLDDDVIIYGDVDEIPRNETVLQAMKLLSEGTKFCHFAQDQYYFFLNLKEVSNSLTSFAGEYRFVRRKKWLGSIACTWKYAQEYAMTYLRDPYHKKVGRRIDKAGWHFTYIGSDGSKSLEDRVRLKLDSSAHQELNTANILSALEENLRNQQDIFGRRRARFEVVKDLSFLPLYVSNNLEKFSYLITS